MWRVDRDGLRDPDGLRNGAMTAAGGNTYAYDVRGRLLSATVSGTTSTYTYDDDGTKIQEAISGGTTTQYVVDKNNLSRYPQILEEHQGSTINSYVIGLTGVISQDMNGTLAYFMFDGNGSTRLLTNTTGGITGEYDYDAYGNNLSLGSGAKPWAITTPTEFQYVDGSLNAAAGGYTWGNRIYTAPQGVWNTRDTLVPKPGDLDNANLDVYVGGNPVNLDDPTGMFTQAMGYAAEAAIDAVYAKDHPFDTVSYGGWTRLGPSGTKAFSLKPDIFNTTTRRWAEIKPLSVSGIAKAVTKFSIYSTAFAPFFYFPDVSWKPSTHFATAGTMPIVFFNAGGIIFYSDDVDAAEDLVALGSIKAVQAFMSSPVGRRIMQSVINIIGDRIPALLNFGVKASALELETDLDIGLITD